MSQFKKGDKVRRTSRGTIYVPHGSVQEVASAENAQYMRLVGVEGTWRQDRFELVGTTTTHIVPDDLPPTGLVQNMPTNPKQAFGDKKVPLHLIHPIAQAHEAAALHAGVRKYGRDNFLASPVETMTYIGAILRHTAAYAAGERVDTKEWVHHLGAVKACCTILLTAEACGTLIDNRTRLAHEVLAKPPVPPTYALAQFSAFNEVEATVAHLNSLYPSKD